MDAFRPNLEIRDAGVKGRGVFSKVLIPRDTVIFEVTGDILTSADLAKYPPSDVDLFFQIGKNTFISMSGDLDDYINHSCNPNCGLRIVGNRALVVTLYQINPGTELTWDYSTTSTDSHDSWKMDCACGDFNCRKIISGFQYLPSSLQENYTNLGVVPNYLVKK